MPKLKKPKPEITAKSNLADLLAAYPKLELVLFEDYGLHCVSCFAASFDSLGEGAKIHGMIDKEIDKMVLRLNKLVKMT
ncbi:hypothetical protein A2160_00485 [Candidatus Beckwithbacteria bacterium RBG_13_42_9]|uniref:DUF1858 domain-containing protein n=1 Tax=Candidatus Beckwithbacteria bacterium RBG_13_42_9 TaxID=1797457 RepID=A0A1F5E3N9_9BACT|nr:MAG: hypothetical protein A2160_00485 [Candidatus Beckwithbacteria bacterium RBG_13_42_9]